MRKSFYALTVAGITFILLLTACKDDDDLDELEEEADSSDVELDFRHTQTEEWGEVRKNHIEEIVDQVTDDHENIDIELDGVDPEEAMERLSVEMMDGDPPDIFELDAFGDEIEEYVEEGNLLDLTDFLEEKGLKDEFINLGAFTVDDRVYGLPFEGTVQGFYYNKDVLDDLGGAPETWDDFIDVIEQGSEEDYTPFISQEMGMENMHLSNMLNIILERTAGTDAMEKLSEGDAEWTDDEMINALEKFKELSDSDFFAGAEEAEEDMEKQQEMMEESSGDDEEMMEEMEDMEQKKYKKLLDGDVLFVYDGSIASASPDEEEETDEEMAESPYGIVALAEEEDKEDMIDDIGFMPLPEISGGKGDQSSLEAQMMSGYGFSGNVNEEEEEAIHHFIEAFWSDESMDRAADEGGMIPAKRVDNISSMDNPIQQEILDAIHETDETFSGMDGSSVMGSMLMDEVGSELDDLTEGNESTESIAEDLQSATDNVIDQMEEQEDME